MNLTSSTCSVILSLAFAATASAQKDKEPEAKGPDNPAIDISKATDKGMAMPTPLDKFIALTLMVQNQKIDWAGTFNDTAVSVDPDKLTDTKVQIPLMLGIRIADGVMAIQGKDAELLGKAASDIEKMAAKLKIPDSDLARAKRARTMANDGKWLEVFKELGFLQQDIMQKLEQNPTDPGSTLLTLSGWIQGSRYTSRLIVDHYTAETSNILREPLLVDALIKKAALLPDDVKKSAGVTKLIEELPKMKKIVDVKIDQPIPLESVKELQQISTSCVKSMTGE